MRTGRSDARLVSSRSSDWLAAEWDVMAPYRDELINSGRDLSYRHILLPSLTELLVNSLRPGSRVLDVGCGTGTFLDRLAADYPDNEFVGIDPSSNSIGIAKSRRQPRSNCDFRAVSVEEFAEESSGSLKFDAVIANMLLQNVASFDEAMRACVSLMAPGGRFVFAVPHPCFWPRYWHYEDDSWYQYGDELWIDAPFQTSLSVDSGFRTTHVHRSLSAYLNGFSQAGLCVEQLKEPMPDAGLADVYPTAWKFPRFLLGCCHSR